MGKRRLTETQVAEIRSIPLDVAASMVNLGVSYALSTPTLAKRFGVSNVAIHNIRHGYSYKRATDPKVREKL